MLEDSVVYPLALAHLTRLERRISNGDLTLPQFHRSRSAILFQYNDLPEAWQLHVLQRLDNLRLKLQGDDPERLLPRP